MPTKKVKFLGLFEDSILKQGESVCDSNCDCYDCNTDNDHAAEPDPD